MSEQGLRRTQTGVVVRAKSAKTCVVMVQTRYRHPVGKYVTKRSKFMVHDEHSVAKENDKVVIAETTPKSKLKRWELVKVIEGDS